MIPTQSAVRAYDVSHLTEHAAHWRDLAERRRNVVGAIKAQADALDWQGQGDEAMKAAMAGHLRTAEEEAGLLDAAAQTAENGASVLHHQQQSMLSGVDQPAGPGSRWGRTGLPSTRCMRRARWAGMPGSPPLRPSPPICVSR